MVNKFIISGEKQSLTNGKPTVVEAAEMVSLRDDKKSVCTTGTALLAEIKQ